MDLYRLRIDNWNRNFISFLLEKNSDLIPLYRIYSTPQFDQDDTIKVGYEELDERYATKEQITRMFIIFDKYSEINKV